MSSLEIVRALSQTASAMHPKSVRPAVTALVLDYAVSLGIAQYVWWIQWGPSVNFARLPLVVRSCSMFALVSVGRHPRHFLAMVPARMRTMDPISSKPWLFLIRATPIM
jgi:hypothetical protein